jgi:YfiH family protein
MTQEWLRHSLLDETSVVYGFGTRGSPRRARQRRPQQVHGAGVTTFDACAGPALPEADVIVSRAAGREVAIVTADCVPILVATADGAAVAAIHAGWRGLAQGVVGTGVAALRELAGDARDLVAVVGPHIGPCCYEVDAPVITGLGERFGAELTAHMRPTRPGHVAVDLGALARVDLHRAGLRPATTGVVPGACTHCDAERFHSYRRDGPKSGRLVHFIAAAASERA